VLVTSQTGGAKIVNYFTFNFGRLALCTSMALMGSTLEQCSRRGFGAVLKAQRPRKTKAPQTH
jgi:hypothetical protein